jgi:hypothetical protein
MAKRIEERRTRLFFATAGLAWLAAVAVPFGSSLDAAPRLARSVMANGGGSASASGKRSTGTVGQATHGRASGSGYASSSGFWSAGTLRVVGVEFPAPAAPPIQLSLGQATPNPSSGAVTLTLAMPVSARVEFSIHDVRGRSLAPAWSDVLEAGTHQLRWHPATSSGPGVYFATIKVGGQVLGRRRITVLR